MPRVSARCLLLRIGLVLVLGLLDKAHTHGTMRVELLTYASDGRTIVGDVCDPGTGTATYCDPQFRVTADKTVHGGDGLFVYQQTGQYHDQNTISFGSTIGIGEGPNPLVMAMNYADNSGSIRLAVYVTDYDFAPGTAGELMSKFTAELQASVTVSTELELRSGNDRLRLRYWFTCSANYFDPLCNTYCLASDDSATGHYSCGTAGEKICLYGWVGPSTACTRPHPCRTCACQHGGICESQGEAYRCHCTGGFSGSNCQNCSLPAGGCTVTAAPTATTTAAAAAACADSACSSTGPTAGPTAGATTAAVPSASWLQADVCFGLGAFVPVAAAACLGCAGSAIFGIMWHQERRRILV